MSDAVAATPALSLEAVMANPFEDRTQEMLERQDAEAAAKETESARMARYVAELREAAKERVAKLPLLAYPRDKQHAQSAADGMMDAADYLEAEERKRVEGR